MVETRIHPGLPRLLVPPDDLVGRFVMNGEFESRERDFVQRILGAGDSFVDVGAHVGVYTIPAGHRVGDTGAVVAIEPHPDSFAVLVRNVAAHGLSRTVRCIQVAASDEDGTAEFHMPFPFQAAWSSLASPSVETARSAVVATRTLDSLLGELRPLLVKVDVEGWERHVLNGGRRLFGSADAPHLLFEVTDTAAAEDLAQLGYDLYRYEPRRIALDRISSNEYETGNVIATKRVNELRQRLARDGSSMVDPGPVA